MEIKAFMVDGDGTCWDYDNEPFRSSWDALAMALPQIKRANWFAVRDKYTQKRYNEINYDEWFNAQLSLIKGLPVSEAEKVVFPIPYSKGVENFFSSLDGRYLKGLVTSGIDFVAEKASQELGLDFCYSNHIETSNSSFTGKGKILIDLSNKREIVKKIAKTFEIFLEEICFVGDNLNDVPVFEVVGLPIAFNPKHKSVEEAAKYTIYDFNELKPFLLQSKI